MEDQTLDEMFAALHASDAKTLAAVEAVFNYVRHIADEHGRLEARVARLAETLDAVIAEVRGS